MADQPAPTTTPPALVTDVPKPIVFGSGSAFGAGGGFSGFTGGFGATATAGAPASGAAAAAEGEEGEASSSAAAEGDGAAEAQEECQAEFKPLVQLEEVEASTGEEEEDSLLELKCKLYRYNDDSNEWKERGIGQIKLLQHKINKKVRLLMRQEKTLKIRANHIVMPATQLKEHSGSDKAWVWSAVDFADEKQSVELFCVRFGTPEKAQEFKKKFYEVVAINEALILPGTPDKAAPPAVAPAEVDELTKGLEATKVADDAAA